MDSRALGAALAANPLNMRSANYLDANSIVGIGNAGALRYARAQDVYQSMSNPPDLEYDFTNMPNGLPAEITCTSPVLSSRGLYVTGSSSAASLLTSTIPGFSASTWTVEVEFELDGARATDRTPVELTGGGTNRISADVKNAVGFRNAVVATCVSAGTVTLSNGPVGAWGGNTDIMRVLFGVGAGVGTFAVDAAIANQPTFAPPASITTIMLGYRGSLADQYLFGWIRRLRFWNTLQGVKRFKAFRPLVERRIAMWGDSLTIGSGASQNDLAAPNVMGRNMARQFFNGGNAGDTSTQIKTRFLANDWRREWVTVIWAGRNNPSPSATVLSDIAAMLKTVPHQRFLILSVINKSDGTENSGSAAYNNIVALNTALAAAYPNNYLDIRSLIVSASGGANDAPNSSYTSDGLHLNDTGYAYVASQVAAFIGSKGW